MPKKQSAKKDSNEDKARRLAKKAHEDAPAHDHRLDYQDPAEHYVARARGLDPAGIVGRDKPAKSPEKPQPPYSR